MSVAILGLLAVNPTCENVQAYSLEEREEGSAVSSVSISFSPSSGSATLSPTAASGASGLVSVLASVGVSNSGGYSVYLGSNDTNLVGVKDRNSFIPGVSGVVSFDNLQDNTWGYTAVEGASIPDSATYKSVSKGQGDIIFTNNNSRIRNERKTFALGFATKITNDIPADTYESQVILSVVSSPYQLTLMDIDDMQEMTSSICENSPQLATKQLRDIRDGKYYWVTKLADGNCWMTQNLDLDLNYNLVGADAKTGVLLIPETSDVKENWIPSTAKSTVEGYTDRSLFEPTATIADASTILPDSLGMRSWSLGDYRLVHPSEALLCPGQMNSLSQCVNDLNDPNKTVIAPYTTPTVQNQDELAHYIVGNHYQWNAATAGSGGSITTGDTPSSICPKGWRLPITYTLSNSYYGLLNAYPAINLDLANNTGDVARLADAPLYFVRSGEVYPAETGLLTGPGAAGTYWSSTPSGDTQLALNLAYWATNALYPIAYLERDRSFSVRCLAR